MRIAPRSLVYHHLEQLVDSHNSSAVFIRVDPGLRSLHGEPRFQRVLSRLGVPTASAPRTVST